MLKAIVVPAVPNPIGVLAHLLVRVWPCLSSINGDPQSDSRAEKGIRINCLESVVAAIAVGGIRIAGLGH